MKTAIQNEPVLGKPVASRESLPGSNPTTLIASDQADAWKSGVERSLFPRDASPRDREDRSPRGPSEPKGSRPAFACPPATPTPKWKRCLDLVLLLAVAPIAVPVLAIAALWVMAVSKGRVLFVQPRVGAGGRLFNCFKLRTMHQGCTTSTHEKHLQQLLKEDRPMLKLDQGDPRLIPGARLLRALGIDELPQLINVLRGDMSVVGPRPCIPYEAEQYERWQRDRFMVLPGLTGLWQVKGKNRTTFLQMVNLDLEYARRQSLGLDLFILFSTPKAILQQLVFAIRAKSGKSARRSSSNGSVPMATAGESGVVG